MKPTTCGTRSSTKYGSSSNVYNGPRDGTNKETNQTWGPDSCDNASCAITTVNGSGPRASANDCTTRMEKKLTHPERGDMTFRTVIETMGGHDLNHLKPLETAEV